MARFALSFLLAAVALLGELRMHLPIGLTRLRLGPNLLLRCHRLQPCVIVPNFAASSAFANNATSCGTAGYNAKITSVSVTPATPVKGQPVALTSSGSLTAAVSNGVSELVVKLDGVSG